MAYLLFAISLCTISGIMETHLVWHYSDRTLTENKGVEVAACRKKRCVHLRKKFKKQRYKKGSNKQHKRLERDRLDLFVSSYFLHMWACVCDSIQASVRLSFWKPSQIWGLCLMGRAEGAHYAPYDIHWDKAESRETTGGLSENRRRFSRSAQHDTFPFEGVREGCGGGGGGICQHVCFQHADDVKSKKNWTRRRRESVHSWLRHQLKWQYEAGLWV